MALSKERLRKFHGIPEPTGPSDPAVLARRPAQEAAARWMARWLTDLQAGFALVGFVVVLLPTLSKPWRAVIDTIPFVAGVFHDYSTFSGAALANLFGVILLFAVHNLLARHIPGGATAILTYRDVAEMELYPHSRKAELAYWAKLAHTLASTTMLLFLPFGVLAYFIRIGS